MLEGVGGNSSSIESQLGSAEEGPTSSRHSEEEHEMCSWSGKVDEEESSMCEMEDLAFSGNKDRWRLERCDEAWASKSSPASENGRFDRLDRGRER